MRALHFFFFLALMSFIACSDKEASIPTERIETTDEYGNMEVYYRRLSNYAKEGTYLRMSPRGNIVEEANFHNDTIHGIRVLFYEQGDTQAVERYDFGLFDGPFRTYFSSGQIQQEGQYENNEMSGDWKRYYESGQLMEVVRFEKKSGKWPFYRIL